MPRRKAEERHDDEESQWSIKRVAIGVFCFVMLATIGIVLFFPVLTQGLKISYEKAVLGASDKKIEQVKLPDSGDIEKIIREAQKNLSQITPDNLTASDAALVKVIEDLQALRGGKKDATDVFCELVCKDK